MTCSRAIIIWSFFKLVKFSWLALPLIAESEEPWDKDKGDSTCLHALWREIKGYFCIWIENWFFKESWPGRWRQGWNSFPASSHLKRFRVTAWSRSFLTLSLFHHWKSKTRAFRLPPLSHQNNCIKMNVSVQRVNTQDQF